MKKLLCSLEKKQRKTDEQDETEYLLGNPENKQILLDGITAIEKGDVAKVKLEAL